MSAANPCPASAAQGSGLDLPGVRPSAGPGSGAVSQADALPGQEPSDGDERIARLIRRQGSQSDGLIEVLHQVQEIHGYLPKPALVQVARALRLPLSRVYGVASFYHLFRLHPPTEHRCAVCLGTACFVRGGGALAVCLQRRLGLELDQAREDGSWALERLSCIGACGQAPVLLLDGVLFSALPVAAPLAAPSAAEPAAEPQGLDRWLTTLGLPAGAETR